MFKYTGHDNGGNDNFPSLCHMRKYVDQKGENVCVDIGD